jgi:tetratricopeptide (TPR) repeat protein
MEEKMKKFSRINLVAATLVVLLGAGVLCQAQGVAVGRVSGKVVDINDEPIKDVKVTVTCPDLAQYKLEATTNKKGRFMLSHVDGTRIYQYRFEKEGYQSLVEQVKTQLGIVNSFKFVMRPPDAGEAGQTAGTLGPSQRAIYTYNEGVAAQQAGDLDLAEERFASAVTIDPQMAAGHTALAGVAHQRGNFEAAAAHAEKAIELDPSDMRALQIMHDAYRQTGNTEKASEAAEAMRQAGVSSEAAIRIYNEAAELYNAGDFESAKVKLKEVIELDPTQVQAYLILGILYLKEGNPSEADAMAGAILQRSPGHTDGLKIRYDAARQMGDQVKAKQALEALVTADPEWAAGGLFEIGVDLFNAGDQAEATSAFEVVLAAKPDHGRAHYFYALCLFASDQQKAGEHLRKFIELAPEDPDVAVAKEMLSYIQ